MKNGHIAILACGIVSLCSFSLPIAGCSGALADSATATETAQEMIANASAGEVIQLAPGNHGLIKLRNLSWSEPVTVIARDARMRVSMRNVENLHFVGGTYADALGTGPNGYAFNIVSSKDISIKDATFTRAMRGLVIGRSQDVALSNLLFTDLRAEGLNMALSRKISVTGLECKGFSPERGDHPDCVQSWSRPDVAPNADIVLDGVRSSGRMQGIFFGNHIRNGVDDGGFDRITIKNSIVETHYTNGIALFDCRDCLILNNTVRDAPDSPNKSLLRLKRCTNCTVEGNSARR